MRRSVQFVSTVLKIIFRHPIPGTTIIPILPDGKIVMVRRQDTGEWSLPGGMVDWGEDIATTVRRELEEETGLELIKIRRLVGVYSSPERDPRIHSISVLIEADVQGIFKVKDTLEISEVRAFKRDELPLDESLSHDHKEQLQNYLQGKTIIA
ncbi:MAG: NUDIX hydrolase [Gomphosphaeria aponina SAG 52.96 = DSM 107014]|uniref:NUDIX hydrolase n=1 Tax=Gomphosphaeria aponina SAG 52.96 = DSM 107014 TaxID=1521640 RepID=A0A941JN86_9CHRO|nr:NUDIX hydrolase [Gomphosphaeria aponina SAG 52.96 = DSM 107014]